MKKLALLLLSLGSLIMGMQPLKEHSITESDCEFVLTKLQQDTSQVTLESTYQKLKQYFDDRNLTDFASVAKFGRENNTFEEPDAVSNRLQLLCNKSTIDQVPNTSKHYKFLLFNTSGIDVFMERLAFLFRITKKGITADRLVALVGTHAHRKDLMDENYLMQLPHLFAQDFDLEKFNEPQAREIITDAGKKTEWQHKDGMQLALKLVSSFDTNMKEILKNFEYYDGNDGQSYRTEPLLKKFLADEVGSFDQQNPIGFVLNAEGAASVTKMVRTVIDDQDAADILIARSVDPEIEGILYNDPQQQRAMTKVFLFYRMLEAICKDK